MDDMNQCSEHQIISTDISESNKIDTWTDEFGVIYSADRKKLLVAPNSIRTYSIPLGTETICNWAFTECEELVSIELCESLLSIGNRAFHQCTSLESIIIPGSISVIGEGAFSGCGLKTVTILNGVKVIGAEAFQACNELHSVNLPDSLIEIEEYAFGGCYQLKEISIPSSVSIIGNNIFEGCTCDININSFYFSGGCDLYSINDKKLIYCSTSVQKYVFTNNIRIIGEDAFFDCKIKSLYLPDSVERIERSAFCGCEFLSSIRLSNSLNYIGDNAFSCCNSIQSISLPKSLIDIGEGVFEDCGSLKSIYVPNGSKERFVHLLSNLKDKIIEKDSSNKINPIIEREEEGLGLSFSSNLIDKLRKINQKK